MGRKLTADEAAEYLGISKSSVQRLHSRGQLAKTGIGRDNRLIRYDVDDLDALCRRILPTEPRPRTAKRTSRTRKAKAAK